MANGTTDDPWMLATPSGSWDYTMYRDDDADPALLICQVGTTRLTYLARAIDDLHSWIEAQNDWVPLGAADEKKPAADGTVEAWARAQDKPGRWAGTASARDTAGVSACTFHRSSKSSASQS